jgi:hypothetical protein
MLGGPGVAIDGGSVRVLIFLIVFIAALCFASRSASLDQDKKKPRIKSA